MKLKCSQHIDWMFSLLYLPAAVPILRHLLIDGHSNLHQLRSKGGEFSRSIFFRALAMSVDSVGAQASLPRQISSTT